MTSPVCYVKRLLSIGLTIAVVFVLAFAAATPVVAQNFDPAQYFDKQTYFPATQPEVLGVQAQEPTPAAAAPTTTPPAEDYHNYTTYTGYVLGFTSTWTPDNPFYFVKRLQENVAVTFTTNPEARTNLLLAIGGERVEEMKTLVDAGKADAAASIADDYRATMTSMTDTLQTLKDAGGDIATLLVKVDKQCASQGLVVEEVTIAAPAAVAGQLAQAVLGANHAVDSIADLAGRPPIPPSVTERLDALQSQGLLSSTEVATIVGADTRVAARQKLQKLAVANVFPEADLEKFDEAACSYYPTGCAQVIEYKKFRDLKKLEEQKPDEATLTQVQTFAQTYTPGTPVPPELRSVWAAMVHKENIEATWRPDLISQNLLRNNTPDYQKFQEVVARLRPTDQDLKYVQGLVDRNPKIAGDPFYGRILRLGDVFGTADREAPTSPLATSCSRDSHWVNVPFMPNGGYCVPNLVYAQPPGGTPTGSSCPPGYHRSDPTGPCLPDNPYGPGIGGGIPVPAARSCPAGYNWVPELTSPRGGYCAPTYPNIGGGPFPFPISPPSYCPQGNIFRDGKCEKYDPAPKEGCLDKSWWNGQKCVAVKECPQGQFQDSNGECKSTADEYKKYESACAGRTIPPGGCGAGYWDIVSCSCKGGYVVQYGTPAGGGGYCSPPVGGCGPYTCWDQGICGCTSCTLPYFTPVGVVPTGYPTGYPGGGDGGTGTPSRETQEANCKAGGGVCVSWVNGACGCERSTGSGGGGAPSCGSGYYWNGSYCAASTGGGTYPTPSGGTYPTPATSCPSGQYLGPGGYCMSSSGGSSGGGTGSYPTPSYYTPSSTTYGTPGGTYGTPSYPTPSGTYGTPDYPTPSGTYSTPSYGTPEYSTPPPYQTPSYGTPSYGTPPP